MLTVHHLGVSQSERIVWLCEELALDYTLVKHTRSPVLAPDSLKSVPGNATGKAPFFVDSSAGVSISESGAICEYLLSRYGGDSALVVKPTADNYAEYLQWFHFSNSSLQAVLLCKQFIDLVEHPADDAAAGRAEQRIHDTLRVVDDRLRDNQWLAGSQFTIADCMIGWSFTSHRYFGLYSLKGYDNILRYLKDCAARPAYQRAREKGDPELQDLITPEPPKIDFRRAGGIDSDIWRKK